MLFAVGNHSKHLPIFECLEKFNVNILSSEQKNISEHFASHQENKFSDIKYTEAKNGAAILDGCLTHIECEIYEKREAGDHVIFILQTENFGEIDQTKQPLIYYKSEYGSIN